MKEIINTLYENGYEAYVVGGFVRDLLLKRDNDDIDVVVDAVDNWESKLVLGQACAKRDVPFLHIGVDGNRGQYCLFEKKSIFDVFDSSIKDEPRDGVMGPMVGLIASMATLHLLNYLVKHESSDVLYYFDYKTKRFGHAKI